MSTSKLLSTVLAALLAVALCATGAFASSSPTHRAYRHSMRLVSLGNAKATLTIATESPGSGQTLSGSTTWSVRVGGAATRVEFAIDGTVFYTQRSAPYLYGGVANGLDTSSLTNGQHTLTATAFGTKGVKATSKVTVLVSNPVTTPTPQPEPAPAPKPEQAPAPTPEPASEPHQHQIYWGATIGSQLTGGQAPWDMTAVSKFEELAQKPVSMIQFFQPFANCSTEPCATYAFPTAPLENIRKHGAIPVLSFASEGTGIADQSAFQLSDVLEGHYDSYLRSFATAAKRWGHPFFLRYDWEMNGNWFPWGEGANGNHPGEYVKAWRHVHDIFTSVGATNVTWAWCPNVDPGHTLRSLSSLYPGDEYVDWTCLDGYNWGTNPIKPIGWKSFDQIFNSTYAEVTEQVAPSKPMMIGEIGSSEDGGSKAAWISDALSRIPTDYSKIRALLWFDKPDSGMDWPIESSPSATSAFAGGIKGSVYLRNSFSGLSASAIAPVG